MKSEETVLQIYEDPFSGWGGRILYKGEEDGRVEGYSSADDVEAAAIESDIQYDRVEFLKHVPPVS